MRLFYQNWLNSWACILLVSKKAINVKAIAERHQSSEIIHALKLLAREGAAARRAGVYDNYVVYVF
jgi:hypothetical protein